MEGEVRSRGMVQVLPPAALIHVPHVPHHGSQNPTGPLPVGWGEQGRFAITLLRSELVRTGSSAARAMLLAAITRRMHISK